MLKHCNKCDQDKPTTEFYKDNRKRDGLDTRCKTCVRKYQREWIDANPEKASATWKRSRKKYRESHREQENEYARNWRRANPEKVKITQEKHYDKVLAWHRSEKGRVAARNRRHKRRMRCQNTDITNQWLLEFLAAHAHCTLCQVEFTYESSRAATYPNVDHITPLNVGGSHTMDNVRIICRGCNMRRPKDGSDLG